MNQCAATRGVGLAQNAEQATSLTDDTSSAPASSTANEAFAFALATTWLPALQGLVRLSSEGDIARAAFSVVRSYDWVEISLAHGFGYEAKAAAARPVYCGVHWQRVQDTTDPPARGHWLPSYTRDHDEGPQDGVRFFDKHAFPRFLLDVSHTQGQVAAKRTVLVFCGMENDGGGRVHDDKFPEISKQLEAILDRVSSLDRRPNQNATRFPIELSLRVNIFGLGQALWMSSLLRSLRITPISNPNRSRARQEEEEYAWLGVTGALDHEEDEPWKQLDGAANPTGRLVTAYFSAKIRHGTVLGEEPREDASMALHVLQEQADSSNEGLWFDVCVSSTDLSELLTEWVVVVVPGYGLAYALQGSVIEIITRPPGRPFLEAMAFATNGRYDVSTMETFVEIAGSALTYLDIRDAGFLGKSQFQWLASKCPNLKSLRVCTKEEVWADEDDPLESLDKNLDGTIATQPRLRELECEIEKTRPQRAAAPFSEAALAGSLSGLVALRLLTRMPVTGSTTPSELVLRLLRSLPWLQFFHWKDRGGFGGPWTRCVPYRVRLQITQDLVGQYLEVRDWYALCWIWWRWIWIGG